MDVGRSRVWKIIIDHTIKTLEVQTSSSNISSYQNPGFTSSKIIDCILTLRLRQMRMDNIHPNISEHQFFIELFCPFYALHKDQHRWIQALSKILSNSYKLPFFTSSKDQFLFYCLRCRILSAYNNPDSIMHQCACKVLDSIR
uniref:Uncharacterized protein n=1 Tax=Opuntia streptacantha TaxID=393608 RepID=A0A7C9F866_OPUST